MKAMGICFGASTIQCAIVHSDPEFLKVDKIVRIPHEGNPQKALLAFLAAEDLVEIDRIAVTGRSFKSRIRLSSISEPEAVELALQAVCTDGQFPDLVVSAGGETQIVYKIGTSGGISSVHSGSKCASGTGEFFLQQIRRMGLSLEQAVAMAEKGTPRKIAGRCSVFCKSDCTHALNKGELPQNIAAGLCSMMAEKIIEMIKDMPAKKLAVIGGGSLNTAMVKTLEKQFPQTHVPDYGTAFEAFGAAVWATRNTCIPFPDNPEDLLESKAKFFGFHDPLHKARSWVDFKEMEKGEAQAGDVCVLGLDVGSTTTKAALIRKNDNAMLASCYLKTNGKPVEASQECYKEIHRRLGSTPVEIIALGVTGSGRQIAALHALTNNVINEIIAHATGAAHFDPEVDTIFEIGGQDAKYIFLTTGVPSDYAMNEACSAGTGSFLEESAFESLNVKTREIGDFALQAEMPPNFSDQCAAFISSDIKRAGQEGIAKNDILAGLVYSICMNYVNRVKGARPTGKKIFMQGGVCYNRAVPVAMASLLQTSIVVPPDPGLMGAYGVALEVIKRLDAGLAQPEHFDLSELIERKATVVGSFVCAGGKEKCDRKCEVNRIRVNDRVYAFGGACNRYYNLRLKKDIRADTFDWVAVRDKLTYDTYAPRAFVYPEEGNATAQTVGFIRSFLTHTLFPLYANFFDKLGFRVCLSPIIDPEGFSRVESAFCLPAELSHGSFLGMLKQNPDYIFAPQVHQLPIPNVPTYSRPCVFVQGEPYYLRTTFRKEIEDSPTKLLSPVLKMKEGYEHAEKAMVETAVSMGISAPAARAAFRAACSAQREYEKDLMVHGKMALAALAENPDTFGIVVFGRPYNAFATEANMGIPHKVASRGYMTIPFDMLPAYEEPVHAKMYWALGQRIVKASQFVARRRNLFGFYITNFSCGPDSFLLSYFRDFMGNKPSLTLEIDQHTADAGIDTRIEAAIDIMQNYFQRSSRSGFSQDMLSPPTHTEQTEGNPLSVVDYSGRRYSLKDKDRVELVLPSMGKYSTEALAAIFRRIGINAKALPVATEEVLLEGRKNTTCKECLPYIVTTGSFLHYLKRRKNPGIMTALFMPTGSGPCRLGQYATAQRQLIHKQKIPNAAVFTLTDENTYAGIGRKNLLRAWQSIVLSDVFSDLRSMLLVAAQDRQSALRFLDEIWADCIAFLEGKFTIRFSVFLQLVSQRLSQIPLARDPKDVPVVSLVGEIYVRRDEFSRKNIVDYLEENGFAVRVAPIIEYFWYCNFVSNTGLGERRFSFQEQIKSRLTDRVEEWWEHRIKSILSQSGLYHYEMVEVRKTIHGATHLMDLNFRGECILTVGLALREILNDTCGVISIGPFGCMPSRVAEAILKKEMNIAGKIRREGGSEKLNAFRDIDTLPFLSVETDGSSFTQLVEANLEAFVLQARRIHDRLADLHGRTPSLRATRPQQAYST